MKTYLLWIIALFSIASYSQSNLVAVNKRNHHRREFIQEHQRIKVVTAEGKRYIGKFSVVDETSIEVDGNVVPLNKIVKLKPKTLAASVANPVLITLGAALVVNGIAAIPNGSGMDSMNFAPMGILVGAPLILIPAISSSYKSTDWIYSIKIKNENSTYSSSFGLGKS